MAAIRKYKMVSGATLLRLALLAALVVAFAISCREP